jgi:hypothetical protein
MEARYCRAITVRGHSPTEQAALKTLYLVTRGLDPKGTGQARWAVRWKPALNAFASPSPTAYRPLKPLTVNAKNTDHRTDPARWFGRPQSPWDAGNYQGVTGCACQPWAPCPGPGLLRRV